MSTTKLRNCFILDALRKFYYNLIQILKCVNFKFQETNFFLPINENWITTGERIFF